MCGWCVTVEAVMMADDDDKKDKDKKPKLKDDRMNQPDGVCRLFIDSNLSHFLVSCCCDY